LNGNGGGRGDRRLDKEFAEGGLGRRGCGEFAPPEVEGGGAQVVSGTVASYGESGRRVGLDVALPPGGRGRRSGIHGVPPFSVPRGLRVFASDSPYFAVVGAVGM